MNIPDEAVEAAAIRLWGTHRKGDKTLRRLTFLALEAAAPHMLAEAFEQGQTSGMRHASRVIAANKIGQPELPGPISPNPYRPTP